MRQTHKLFAGCELYKNDIYAIASGNTAWDKLKNKSLLITGATGLIGTFLVDLLMHRNIRYNDNITIFAMGRSKEKALYRFNEYLNSKFFVFVQKDILAPLALDFPIDYIIHGASYTHPIAYASEPKNTILLSVLGTKSILDIASISHVKRMLFISTVEIYGENRGDIDAFDEKYCGYIDCNTLRAGYPEGKRAAEALCQAYITEKNIDITIARCSRVYGPTMGNDDSKAIAQFIKCAVKNENILLKSEGTQLYSYCYVADTCSAILHILLNGRNGEAYNISDSSSKLTLMQIASYLSDCFKIKIDHGIPSSTELAGYSKAAKALLDCSKLKKLGWEPRYSIYEGLKRTVEILRNDTLVKL